MPLRYGLLTYGPDGTITRQRDRIVPTIHHAALIAITLEGDARAGRWQPTDGTLDFADSGDGQAIDARVHFLDCPRFFYTPTSHN